MKETGQPFKMPTHICTYYACDTENVMVEKVQVCDTTWDYCLTLLPCTVLGWLVNIYAFLFYIIDESMWWFSYTDIFVLPFHLYYCLCSEADLSL